MRYLIWLLLAALLPVCGAQNLAARLDPILASSPALAGAMVGLQVVRLSDGAILYSHHADQHFVPASNMKLFTSALALSLLGPDYRFTTEIRSSRAIDSNGCLDGDLALVGGGDPSLSGRAYPYQYERGARPGASYSFRAIEEFADQIAALGLKQVRGDIAGDDRRYTWEPRPGGWARGDAEWEYGAPVSALMLDDNSLAITLRPGARPGDLSQIWLTPPFEYFSIDNRVTTGAGPERKVEFEREPSGRELHIRGVLPAGSPGFAELLAVDDPALYAAEALRDALQRRGIAVDGQAVARHRFADDSPGAQESGAPEVVLAKRTSPPLSEVLQVLDKVSQNLHAEVLLREAALAKTGQGTSEAGLSELRDFVRAIGLAKDCCQFTDGSGLSRGTLVTPAAITALLAHMYKSKDRDLWLTLLPVGGADGTLANRFAEHPEAKAIHAKTGTLAHVRAMSGYVLAPGRDAVAFSLLVNNAVAPGAEVAKAMDRIALALVR